MTCYGRGALCCLIGYGMSLISTPYTLSLHDALPISRAPGRSSRSGARRSPGRRPEPRRRAAGARRRRAAASPSCSSPPGRDRKSTRLNSSHGYISYAVFCLKKKIKPFFQVLQVAVNDMLWSRSTLLFDRIWHVAHFHAVHSFPTRRSSDLSSAWTLVSIRRSEIARAATGTAAASSRSATTARCGVPVVLVAARPRSEEHTSELQSRLHLVCRLLLEKKNQAVLPGAAGGRE